MHHYFVSYLKTKDKFEVGQCCCDIKRTDKIKSSREIWDDILRSHNSKHNEDLTGISIISINYLGEFEEEK